MNIRFLKTAQKELNDSFDWYENQLSGLGYDFLKEVDSAIGRIITWPESHLGIGHGLHRCLVKRFPYSVIYGMENNTIVIVAMAHLHRKPYFWVERF